MLTEFSLRLLEWYQKNARQLPWRIPPTDPNSSTSDTCPPKPDPYRIWVSEVMLQQTQVETVLTYFARWIEHFPTLQALADAPEQEVLTVWEGLGYYHRALNFHKAARFLVEHGGGQIPTEKNELEKLPGIGPYTAGAIASMAFHADEPALDGNIRRVLSRFFNLDEPVSTPKSEKQLAAWASDNLPHGQASDYNQALMDLGATLCTPRSPKCLLCPLMDLCESRRLGIQEERPISKPRRAIPHIIVTAGIIAHQGKILIAKRPAKGLLAGLWEFPGGKQEQGETLPACLTRELKEELNIEVSVGNQFGVYQHAYTHFRVTLHAFLCRLISGEPVPLQASELRWVSIAEMETYPMGKIDRAIANQLRESTMVIAE